MFRKKEAIITVEKGTSGTYKLQVKCEHIEKAFKLIQNLKKLIEETQ